ncbi:MAG: hypothetical protein B6D64_03875 [Bacteroidetes bacterium 4484_276]|nr:MAG: hypothetical protein B6D64_03875 [Bacteroidetes bacterium 4484_276]
MKSHSKVIKPGSRFLQILTLVILSITGFAQKIPVIDSLSLYGNICGQLAFYKEIVEVQNNGSKAGLYIDYSINKGVKIFGNTEWAINLVDNNYSFNASAITDENIPDALFDETNSAFTTRLGYLGVDFKKYGILTIGKQWSAYYDVSGWTDMFTVFGGQASSTYLTGTDGGETGAGRAAKAVVYRNKLGPLKFSLQAQLNGVRANYGGSVSLKLYKGLHIGAGINDIRISKDAEEYIMNVKDFEVTGIFGVKYQSQKVYAAFNFNLHGGDVIPIHEPDTVFVYGYHFSGYEFYTKYNIKPWLSVHGGLNIQVPTTKNTIIDDNFHLAYYVVGGEISVSPAIKTYIELKFDDSVNAEGKHSFNVYTAGLNIDFDKAFGNY